MTINAVSFPDSEHPMNKGSDQLVTQKEFLTYLVEEMRRQAKNEIIRETALLPVVLPPLVIYDEPFPVIVAGMGEFRKQPENEICHCFWCST